MHHQVSRMATDELMKRSQKNSSLSIVSGAAAGNDYWDGSVHAGFSQSAFNNGALHV